MKASRPFIPGGWLGFWTAPSAAHRQHRLLLAAAIFLLAAWPAAGADATLPAWLADGDRAPAEEFSGDAPVFHSKDAPSDARVLLRIRNSAGLRGTFSLTHHPDAGSADPGNHRGVLLTNAPHHFLPQLTRGQSSLAAFTAGTVGRHFMKLSIWSGQSGAGVLYPLSSTVGLFVDARRGMPYGVRSYGIARAGLQILF